MKRNNFRFIGLAIFLAGVFLFTACNQFLNSSGGSITVNLPNGNARLAADDLNTYTISLLDSSGNVVQSVSVSSGSCTLENIAQGDYTISVSGEYADGSEKYNVANGKTAVTVVAGETAEANIVMKQTGFFVAQLNDMLLEKETWKEGDDDNNSGGSPKSPFKNLQTAIDKIAGTSDVAGINDGESEYTIYVKGMIYPRITAGGTTYKMADFSDIPENKKLNISIVGIDTVFPKNERMQTILSGNIASTGGAYGSIVIAGTPDISLPKLNLTLENLAITEGVAHRGGGIFNNGATITITNCDICYNYLSSIFAISGDDCLGGAIYNWGGKITIENSTLNGNKAADKNTASFRPPNGGGAATSNGGVIFNDVGGDVYINNCIIENNYAVNCGGVIFNNKSAKATITGCEFNNNDANYNGGDSGSGGAIFNNSAGTSEYIDGVLIVKDCTFTGNSARGGGAISNNGKLEVTNCTITDGKANGMHGGGAIYNNKGTVEIYGGTYEGNTADVSGGFIHNTGALKIFSGTFENNTAGDGGAIYNADGEINILDGTFGSLDKGNSASQNGGAICNAFGTLNISGGKIMYNTASQNGGAIYNAASGGILNITGGEISNNKVQAAYSMEAKGGAIYNGGTLEITGGLFENNETTNTANGGAIYHCEDKTSTQTKFSLGDSALFVINNENNDIFLEQFAYITVISELNDNFFARITPAEYPAENASLQVFSDDSETGAEIYSKFKVTPTQGVRYHIDTDGKLKRQQ